MSYILKQFAVVKAGKVIQVYDIGLTEEENNTKGLARQKINDSLTNEKISGTVVETDPAADILPGFLYKDGVFSAPQTEELTEPI